MGRQLLLGLAFRFAMLEGCIIHPVEMKKDPPSLRLAATRYALITLVALLIVAVYRRVLHVNQTTVALTFLVLVLLVATRWRLAYSVYLSLLCTLLYNFFFLPPIGTLTISDPQNWVTLGAFLVASVLVSHLADGERRAAAQSEARREDVERLFEFSEQLLLHDDLRALARTAPSLIASIFKLARLRSMFASRAGHTTPTRTMSFCRWSG